MDLDGIGYARQLQAERAALLANVAPRHRARLLGRPAPHVQMQSQLIETPQRPEPPKTTLPPSLARYARSRGAAMHVISLTAEEWQTLPYVILSRNNSPRASHPRFACYWLLYDRVNLSTSKIGHILQRDHTTILEGIKRAKHLHDHDPDWRCKYDAVVSRLEEGERP